MSVESESQVAQERGAVAARISREIVQLHAELYGRGPTKAKTYVSDDHVLSLLEDVFTRAERTLVSAGHEKEVMQTRSAFQDAVAQQFRAIVENATGRRVRAFMSTSNIEPEISAELFLLEPTPGANLSSDGGPVASDGASAGSDGASAGE
jgi:uncharacterized protein YbcI